MEGGRKLATAIELTPAMDELIKRITVVIVDVFAVIVVVVVVVIFAVVFVADTLFSEDMDILHAGTFCELTRIKTLLKLP